MFEINEFKDNFPWEMYDIWGMGCKIEKIGKCYKGSAYTLIQWSMKKQGFSTEHLNAMKCYHQAVRLATGIVTSKVTDFNTHHVYTVHPKRFHKWVARNWHKFVRTAQEKRVWDALMSYYTPSAPMNIYEDIEKMVMNSKHGAQGRAMDLKISENGFIDHMSHIEINDDDLGATRKRIGQLYDQLTDTDLDGIVKTSPPPKYDITKVAVTDEEATVEVEVTPIPGWSDAIAQRWGEK